MNLGWCDFCLRVKNVATSRQFYSDLGFWRVEGSDEVGWAVVTNGELRLGFFEAQFMDEDVVSLNFRGGDIAGIVSSLREKGLSFERAKLVDGGGSASLRDPDGYSIFFDTEPGEIKKMDPLP